MKNFHSHYFRYHFTLAGMKWNQDLLLPSNSTISHHGSERRRNRYESKWASMLGRSFTLQWQKRINANKVSKKRFHFSWKSFRTTFHAVTAWESKAAKEKKKCCKRNGKCISLHHFSNAWRYFLFRVVCKWKYVFGWT